MSISSNPSASQSDAWEDMEQQLYNFKFALLEGKLSNPQTSERFDNLVQLEPAGGLHRGEVAELVAVEKEHFEVSIRPGSDDSFGTQPGYAFAEFQPSRSPFRFEDRYNDVPKAGTTARIQTSEDGDEVLFFDKTSASQSYFDGADTAVNSNAKQPNPVQGTEGYFNFRDELGMGPLFFEDDTVNDHASLTAVRVVNDQVVARGEYKLIWDVMEAQDLPTEYLPSRLL
jgi:hypothetical protein